MRFAKGEWWCGQSYANPSPSQIPLLSGKITGNFAIFGLLEAISVRKAPVPQRFPGQFPAKINREIIFGNREISGRNREICNASEMDQTLDPTPPDGFRMAAFTVMCLFGNGSN